MTEQVEGQTATPVVRGGYDGGAMMVNRVYLEMMRQDLARGMAVYATYGDRVGTVDGIDAAGGYMVVKGNPFSTHDLFIPFTAIDCIILGEVFLARSSFSLLKECIQLPDAVVLHMDGA